MKIKIILTVILIISLLGCSSTRSSMSNQQMQQFQSRIIELEQEMQQRDDEIARLKSELNKSQKSRAAKSKTAGKTSSAEATPKGVQTALKNAGFYKGQIDGKIGQNTKRAIMDFQKANGLATDGIVGKKTWLALCEYL